MLPYPTIAFNGKIYYEASKKTEYDVIIVTGDAYVDHAAFPTAVIFRTLEYLGLSVAIIAQPNINNNDEFTVFKEPKLFFAVTSGAMDSMVANYTATKMPRSKDRLSPEGKPGLRPKRALNSYVQKLRQLYKSSKIVVGGIEASLRRYVHYDFWEDKLRDPVLFDAPADILVYGMGEAVIREIVDWCRNKPNEVPQIPQTCIKVKHREFRDSLTKQFEILPSVDDCRKSKQAFMELSRKIDVSVRPDSKILIQEHFKGDVICFPPSEEFFKQEILTMDRLNYNRMSHPIYEKPIPGLEPVQFSIQSHRGCLSACSFCALSLHQGRVIRSRSIESIISEITLLSKHPDFKGIVSDIGGPSANMYGWECKIGGCETRMCVHPKICPNLKHSLRPLVTLLKAALKVQGVRKVFLGSGLRYDLIRDDEWDLFEYIIKNHVSGQLKVAPEHFDKSVLTLMRKGENADFGKFIQKFYKSCEKIGKKLYVVPYLMTAFPGNKNADNVLKDKIKELRLVHEQIQEFTPTPGSLASAMYYTELDYKYNEIKVSKTANERKKGRQIIQKC